ncbi:MAG: dihydropteroate synthase, partial [Thermoanaerobaculia bacterium]
MSPLCLCGEASLHHTPGVMGILNITPDSFSDGGVHFDKSKALHAALQMADDGADVLDLGGESTRPGAEPVSADE